MQHTLISIRERIWGANVLKILLRARRERGIRGRDDNSVELGCGSVVDEEEVRYFEDEGVVGGDWGEPGCGRTIGRGANYAGRRACGLLC